ncbi:MAG: NAD(P)/FAD-dependent oxidoreductase [Bryobacteraceae bacterium]
MPDRSQVVVIGAGIVGASIAWRLAQSGADVTLVDAGALGGEASWAGAGMLAPGGEFVTRSSWAEFALESMKLYPAFVAELESETGLPIDYRRCGAMEFARTESEWQELLARRAAQSEIGIRAEAVPGGLFYPDDALVDPRDVTRALRCACERCGVDIREHTRVTAVRLAAQRVDVETGGEVLSGEAAVLSAGAWSGAIPVLRDGARIDIPATFPVRGHLLGYSLAPQSRGPILRHGHTYVMQRSSGFTIAGTSSEQVGFNRELDLHIVEDIACRAAELCPQLRSAGNPIAWLGFRPATADFNPVIRRLEDTSLWLAYGHYRNGILLAPATAARVAHQIAAAQQPQTPVPSP